MNTGTFDNFELPILKFICVIVADEFEIGDEELTVFLLNQTFHEGVSDEEELFILSHTENNNDLP